MSDSLNWLDELKGDDKGLIPAIAQDEAAGLEEIEADASLEKQANIPITTKHYWKAVEPVIKNPDEIYK